MIIGIDYHVSTFRRIVGTLLSEMLLRSASVSPPSHFGPSHLSFHRGASAARWPSFPNWKPLKLRKYWTSQSLFTPRIMVVYPRSTHGNNIPDEVGRARNILPSGQYSPRHGRCILAPLWKIWQLHGQETPRRA
jgi:hypothetical protein